MQRLSFLILFKLVCLLNFGSSAFLLFATSFSLCCSESSSLFVAISSDPFLPSNSSYLSADCIAFSREGPACLFEGRDITLDLLLPQSRCCSFLPLSKIRGYFPLSQDVSSCVLSQGTSLGSFIQICIISLHSKPRYLFVSSQKRFLS